MKTLIMATVLVIAASSLSFAQEEKAIMKLEDEYWQAIIRNDVTGVNRLVTEDFFHTNPSGRAGERGNKRSGDVNRTPRGWRYDAINFEDHRVRIYGDMAVSTALRKTTLSKKGKSRVTPIRSTRVWVKRQGQWKMVASA